ncbi:MAG: hypothetical protein AB7E60_11035 [Sphingobium sp.]
MLTRHRIDRSGGRHRLSIARTVISAAARTLSALSQLTAGTDAQEASASRGSNLTTAQRP